MRQRELHLFNDHKLVVLGLYSIVPYLFPPPSHTTFPAPHHEATGQDGGDLPAHAEGGQGSGAVGGDLIH